MQTWTYKAWKTFNDGGGVRFTAERKLALRHSSGLSENELHSTPSAATSRLALGSISTRVRRRALTSTRLGGAKMSARYVLSYWSATGSARRDARALLPVFMKNSARLRIRDSKYLGIFTRLTAP